MAKYQGLGERLTKAMKDAGYVRTDGKVDVIGFAEKFNYNHSYIYRWLDGQAPSGIYLVRICRDLTIDPEWLLGERTRKNVIPVPIAGGASNVTSRSDHSEKRSDSEGDAVTHGVDEVPLIRSWGRGPMVPAWYPLAA